MLSHIRPGKELYAGALTNGQEWIFLILYLNKDGNGGTCTESPIIKLPVNDNNPYHVLSLGPHIVGGIMAYWVCCTLFSFCALTNRFDSLDDND